MTDSRPPVVGQISWVDLTEADAPDLEASLAACRARGGAVIDRPRAMGPEARYAVIRDPAGAVAALYQPLV